MNKKYEAPQLDVQYFNVIDIMTSDGSSNYSGNLPDEPEYGWGEW